MLGNLLDGYIEGNFYVGNNEKIPPEKLELATFIERMWQKDKRVRHNEKHKEKSHSRRGRN